MTKDQSPISRISTTGVIIQFTKVMGNTHSITLKAAIICRGSLGLIIQAIWPISTSRVMDNAWSALLDSKRPSKSSLSEDISTRIITILKIRFHELP